MAAVTRANLKARIEALLDDIPNLTVFTGAERIIASTSLPAVEVGIGDATYTRQALGANLVVVTVEFDVVVRLVGRPESDADRNAAIEACYDWQDTLADFFMARPRLERNDSGVAFGTGDMTFTRPGITPYKESTTSVYAGFGGSFPVTIRR